ncbi:MAG: peptidoglycan DD-metalloendopeptidase family protein [Desulfotomaculaceae bacterium]|nr:peptidoglycan DD-metalloendopeptidase family protein [Desulfotomaculaceae bacterium]
MPQFDGGMRRLPGFAKLITSFDQWFSRQSTSRQIGIGVAIYLIISVIAYTFYGDNACAVVVDDKVIAVVDNEKNAKRTLGELVKFKSDQVGMNLFISQKVSYKSVRVEEDEILDLESFRRILGEALSLNTEVTSIVVNGEKKIFLKNNDAEELLEWLGSIYLGEPGEQVEFKEKVELVTCSANIDELIDLEGAKKLVLHGTGKSQQYTVREGDTAWDIAEVFKMNLEQLKSVNPELDLERLNAGQILTICQGVPLINVIATRQETVVEEIPFKVEVKDDDSLFSGEKKVIREGVPGQRIVTYQITKENGLEISRQVCEQSIIREPLDEIIFKGSQTMLASRGGSTRMNWPCAGSVSSAFGMRGGRMHQGIDLSAVYGSPVTSSAAGRIAFAGWEGGYGKMVEVSHGGGFVTRYAHLSSISVSTGQQVDRGQLIGLVGATGHATGPHLHFEVLINGRQHNPINYLP